jgi:hypothetical protein
LEREGRIVPTIKIELTPVQRLAAERALAGLRVANVVLLKAAYGTVLRAVHASTAGVLLGAREFMTVLAAHSPSSADPCRGQWL